MRIRNGFVSNSSSSSFVLCGSRIFPQSWYELANAVKSSLVVMRKANGGTSGSNEDILVRMAPDYVGMFMKANVALSGLEFFDASYMCDAFGNFTAAKDGYPEEYVASFRKLNDLAKKNGDSAFEFEMDSNSPNPAKALESDYYRVVEWTGLRGGSPEREDPDDGSPGGEGTGKDNLGEGKWLDDNTKKWLGGKGFGIASVGFNGSGGEIKCVRYEKNGCGYQIWLEQYFGKSTNLWECTFFIDGLKEQDGFGHGADAESAYKEMLDALGTSVIKRSAWLDRISIALKEEGR